MKSDKFPLAVLLGAVALIAAVAFAVSAHGLYDFGQRVMGLPGMMAAGVPIILDAGQLAAIAAAFVNRNAKHKRVRFYMWMVMGVTVALSMAGNAWDAHVRDLTRAGIYATMIAPALLALFAHVIVITWRHREPVAVPAPVVVRKRQPSKPKLVKPGRVDPVKVRQLQAQGLTQQDVAQKLDIGVRSVARYWIPKAELVPSLNGDAA